MTQIEQIQNAIQVRIKRICGASYRAANFLKNGKKRKKYVPYTVPAEAETLLELEQALLKGEETPEAIFATITFGDIQEKFLNS